MKVFQFDLNDFRCSVMLDGQLPIKLEELFPATKDHFAPEDHPEFAKTIAIHILLVDTGSQRVLIDTGMGRDVGSGEGKLVERLAEVDVTPDMIDAIIFTHAHWDHIGGIINAEGELVFKNTSYYMPEREWKLFTSAEELAKMPENIRRWAEECLPPIADQVKLFAPGDEVLPGFKALAVPGHTPGQVAILITSGDQTLLDIADVALHTMQIHYPDISVVLDMDAKAASVTRRQVWAQFGGTGMLVHGFHFPFPGLGTIEKDGVGYRWQPWRDGE